MIKKTLILIVNCLLLLNLEAKSNKPKDTVLSQAGLCFMKSETVGQRQIKKYMFAGEDGIVYEITNPRYISQYVGKAIYLTGKAREQQNKDGTVVNSVMPKQINLIVCGKIETSVNEKTKRRTTKLTTKDDNTVYYLLGNPQFNKQVKELDGKELTLWGGVQNRKLKSGGVLKQLTIAGYEGEPVNAPSSKSKKKNEDFAKTDKKLPAEEVKTGATVSIELPELGNSAASGGKKPIEMTVFLPDNYSANQKHPVIVHMSGGMGSSKGAGGWKNVTDNKNFILLGADYSFKENKEKDLLKLGTCRDFDYKIAAHCLQVLKNSTAIDEETIILAGASSGGYSITESIGCDNTDIFAGFCPIIGGQDNFGKVEIGEKSILFIAGENDTQYDRTGLIKKAYNALKSKNPNVKLYLQKGVGHAWSPQTYPVQKEWLFSEFTNLKKYKQWATLEKNAEDPEVKKYYGNKLNSSWFKYSEN